MTTVRELIALLKFDLDGASVKKADQAFDKIREKAQRLTRTVAAIGGAAAAGLGALLKVTDDTAAAGVGASRLAARLGITTDSAQELAYAGATASLEVDQLAAGLTHLSVKADAASRGQQEAAIMFTRLGVRYRDTGLRARNLDDILGDVAERFAKLPEGPQRAAYAVHLFGESGAALIPILAKGRDGLAELRAEAHELGAVMDSETIEASKEWRRESVRLRTVVLSLRNAVGAALLPVLTPLIGKMRDWVLYGRALAKSRAWVDGFATALTGAGKVMGRFLVLGNAIVTVLGGAKTVAMLLAAVLGGVLAYQVGALIVAVNRLGLAGLVMYARLLAVPLAIGAAFLALAGLIFLIWDDINVYLQGGDSLIGRFVDNFLDKPIDPNAHWMVRTIRAITQEAREAYGWVMSLVSTIKDAKTLWSGDAKPEEERAASQRLLQQQVEYVAKIRDDFKGMFHAPLRALSGGHLGEEDVTAAGRRWVADQAAQIAALKADPTGAIWDSLHFRTPATSTPAGPPMSMPPIEFNQTLHVGAGVDPREVGEAARTGGAEGLQSVIRDAELSTRSSVVR